jgi:hypothetical protein
VRVLSRIGRDPAGELTSDRAGWVRTVALLGVIAVVVLAFYLVIYRLNTFETPLGWDSPKYLWRTGLAAEVGVTGLPERVPPPANASPDRPGFPVLALTLSATTGEDPFLLAAAFPALTAAAIGLAGGAFLVAGLRRPRWQGALFAAVLGTSSLVVRLAGPESYQDNMFAAAVLLAALVPLTAVARGDGGVGLGVGLLIATAAIHWAFFGVFVGVLLLTLLWRRREWFRRDPRSPSLLRSPGGRLLLVAAGSLIGGVAVYLILGAVPDPPVISEPEFTKKLSDTIGRLDWLVLPLAAVGVLAEARRPALPGRPWERFPVDLLLVWTGVVGVAIVLGVAGVPVPAHRFLAFALPVPIFAFLGVIRVAETIAAWGRRRSARWGPVLGVVAAAALIGIAGFQAADTWLETRPNFEPRKSREAAAVAAYLDAAAVPADRPVVFVVDDRGPNPDLVVPLMGHVIRTAIPPERIPNTYLYVGDPSMFEDRHPTILRTGESARYDGVSWRFFREVRPLYGDDPVAVITPSFNLRYYGAWVSEHPGSVVAPNVSVVAGPGVSEPIRDVSSPVGPIDPYRLSFVACAVLAILFLIGLGWTVAGASPGSSRFVVVAMAPAVGVAVLVLGGLVIDALGVRLTGFAGGAVVPALAVAGAVVGTICSRRTEPPAATGSVGPA